MTSSLEVADVRSLFGRRDAELPEVQCDGKALSVGELNINWCDVVRIEASLLDCFTFDTLHVLIDAGEKHVWINEDMQGFDHCLATASTVLGANLAGIDSLRSHAFSEQVNELYRR